MGKLVLVVELVEPPELAAVPFTVNAPLVGPVLSTVMVTVSVVVLPVLLVALTLESELLAVAVLSV